MFLTGKKIPIEIPIGLLTKDNEAQIINHLITEAPSILSIFKGDFLLLLSSFGWILRHTDFVKVIWLLVVEDFRFDLFFELDGLKMHQYKV
jgi:hypothetical protein